MAIEYRINAPLKAEEVADVFRSSGIKRPVGDLARIQVMIDQADLNLSAWDGDTLVGIARAITDFSYCCYLSDLAVRKEYQNRASARRFFGCCGNIWGSRCPSFCWPRPPQSNIIRASGSKKASGRS